MRDLSRRRLWRGLALLALASLVPAALPAQRAAVVVRHGEKVSEEDERLSEAGLARARRLAALLKDAGVAAIYSTDTPRTRGTAAPLAEAIGVEIRLYDPKLPAALAGSLRKNHPRDLVLIVGHSNTVPDLLAALGCAEAVAIRPDEYDNLFVVVPRDGKAELLRLRY